jgi:WD40 repeat protein
VNALCITGSKLFSGSGDRSIIVWDLNTQQQLQRILVHDKGVLDLRLAAGKFLVSASSDGTCRIFDLSRNEQVVCLMGHTGVVSCARVVSNAKLEEEEEEEEEKMGVEVVTGSYDGTVRWWKCGGDGRWEGRVVWRSGGETDAGVEAMGEGCGRPELISDVEVCGGRVFVARFDPTITVVDI